MSRAGLAAVVAVSGTGLALAGCGSSAKTTSPRTAPAARPSAGNARRLSVVKRAVAKTTQVKGARVLFVAGISTPKGPLAMKGSGVFALDSNRGSLTATVSGSSPVRTSSVCGRRSGA